MPDRVAAAVNNGARSWSAVARQVGCSRTWAKELAQRAGLTLDRNPPRKAWLHVRVRGPARDALDAEARLVAASTGRPVHRSQLVRELLAEALDARRRRRS